VDSFYTGPGPSTAYWVSGAALRPDGKQLMLISYPRCWLFSGYPGADFFGGTAVMRTYSLSQMEGVAWKDSNHVYLCDELINGAFGGKLYEAAVGGMVLLREGGQVSRLVASPNPFPGRVTVRMEMLEAGQLAWELLDARGRKVDGEKAQWTNAGAWEKSMGDALPKGIYFLRVKVRGELWVLRLVKA
jgi:hypothetical protein